MARSLSLTDHAPLVTSDHFCYLCLKGFADGDVHRYFSPYESPYDACIYFMNVVNDLRLRCGLDREAGRAPAAGSAAA